MDAVFLCLEGFDGLKNVNFKWQLDPDGLEREENVLHLLAELEPITLTGVKPGATKQFIDFFRLFDISQGKFGVGGIVTSDHYIPDTHHTLTQLLGKVDVLNADQFEIFNVPSKEPFNDLNALGGDRVGFGKGQKGTTVP